MKLLRYGPSGRERPGLVDAEGSLRDLSGVIADVTPEVLAPAALAKLKALDPKSLPKVEGSPRLGVPVKGVGKFIAIGLNFSDHAAESNMAVPSEPVFFTKAISCLCGPNDDVMMPFEGTKLDWEVELGVFIGTTCRHVEKAKALDHVAGFVLVNDVSERAFQMERGSQWDKGKGCDTFGPTGPWLVTGDEIADCQALDMFLDVNGKRMQTGNTRTMIFDVAECIAYVSRFITLNPGDLLITGTPPGVGLGQKPDPIYLAVGDEMRLGISQLGEQRQRVVAFNLEGCAA
jgi:2-keto-4-pentenoate hydratase/2-oxohepta-3-ene-1,7-dioic acid hydratase in catechol pathway